MGDDRMNALIPHYELSRIYHCQLAEYDAAIRALEDDPAALPLKEFDYLLRGLQHDRAALKAEWEKEQDKKGA
jgi:hypothetical protein